MHSLLRLTIPALFLTLFPARVLAADYTGRWMVNLSTVVSKSGCKPSYRPPALGRDIITVTQDGEGITFSDGDGNLYTGRTTANGFRGGNVTAVKGGRLALIVALQGVASKPKGSSSAQMIITKLPGGASCTVKYKGSAKRLP